ncbi:Uncharacterized protein HZ326_9024 [Fusarium oxysporum f. sp. albedinis]|nr:Uncharacterized protein HZ326_9024 [Fusarium oxysporum f. sp. albedinis]
MLKRTVIHCLVVLVCKVMNNVEKLSICRYSKFIVNANTLSLENMVEISVPHFSFKLYDLTSTLTYIQWSLLIIYHD